MSTPLVKKNIRSFQGVVVSDAADKTITVAVKRTLVHKRYRKRYVQSTKYLVHDPKNQYHIGNVVTIQACRPISRHKRWIVVYPSV
ncbi:MAG: 30S ribosomal protein S17 [Patescibacteria group bacterium]|jgi:small subunit ribosomal protein S17